MRASQLKMINCPSQYSLRNISKRWSSSTFPRGIFSLDMLTCSSSKHTVHCQGIPTFPAYQQQNLQNHCSCLYWLYYVTGPLQFFGWMKIMHLQAVSWNWHMSPSRAIYAINATHGSPSRARGSFCADQPGNLQPLSLIQLLWLCQYFLKV